jgi:hypothetical protein
VKSLRLNKDIRILQAERDNCMMVLDDSKYKDKLNTNAGIWGLGTLA